MQLYFFGCIYSGVFLVPGSTSGIFCQSFCHAGQKNSIYSSSSAGSARRISQHGHVVSIDFISLRTHRFSYLHFSAVNLLYFIFYAIQRLQSIINGIQISRHFVGLCCHMFISYNKILNVRFTAHHVGSYIHKLLLGGLSFMFPVEILIPLGIFRHSNTVAVTSINNRYALAVSVIKKIQSRLQYGQFL